MELYYCIVLYCTVLYSTVLDYIRFILYSYHSWHAKKSNGPDNSVQAKRRRKFCEYRKHRMNNTVNNTYLKTNKRQKIDCS